MFIYQSLFNLKKINNDKKLVKTYKHFKSNLSYHLSYHKYDFVLKILGIYLIETYRF